MKPEEKQYILRERALRLKNVSNKEMTERSTINGIEFLLSDEHYIIPNSFTKEVTRINALTEIPGAPDFVKGIINFRGKILSVLDIRLFFGLQPKGITNLNSVILVEWNELEFGILADQIFGNINYDDTDLFGEIPEHLSQADSFIEGVTQKGHIVLDMKALMDSKKIIVHK
ncbi:MAG: hypothetical protein C0593_07345 [Marinilabiliales bacterium]|nr:MAG: hypothetical protein C0593_07345 [Marinilabiliales bacterium]